MQSACLMCILLILTISQAVKAAPVTSHSVVIISIDGLRGEDVARARERGLHIEHILLLKAEGTSARSVINMIPTITYPNHTTLITGVEPARHLILGNRRFDPAGLRDNACYWFAEEIHAPTLWDAVHDAGGRVANIYWPVSVGSKSIDVNFPELWAGGQPKDWPLIAALSTIRLLPGDTPGEKRTALMRLIEPTTDGDQARVNLALEVLKRENPQLLTLHLVSLDEIEHKKGPDSAAKAITLTALDNMIGQFVGAMRKNDPQTRIVLVSDHGQTKLTQKVNLGILLVKAGLEVPDLNDHAVSWRAAIWGDGIYLVVADPAARASAMKALADYAAAPGSAIERIVPMDQSIPDVPRGRIAATIFLRPGFGVGSALSGSLLTPATETEKGQHGGSPDDIELRSVFIAAGPGIPRGRNLGVIDMRSIAPTVSHLLAVPMTSAGRAPLF